MASVWAAIATLSSIWMVPVRVPGGKPITETPIVPRLPPMLVGPVLVIPALPERTPKVAAVPRDTA